MACMRYKPVFKQPEMELVKLTQSWDNGTSMALLSLTLEVHASMHYRPSLSTRKSNPLVTQLRRQLCKMTVEDFKFFSFAKKLLKTLDIQRNNFPEPTRCPSTDYGSWHKGGHRDCKLNIRVTLIWKVPSSL
jgi:hypothetical protein